MAWAITEAVLTIKKSELNLATLTTVYRIFKYVLTKDAISSKITVFK
ncbi:MAG: hypothetical protein LBJ95_05310 [Oscillospiraceae bacterium]|nr:hypothetical protein [Oscillospiraceae bacterium]